MSSCRKVPAEPVGTWTSRSDLQLLQDQLAALAVWHEEHAPRSAATTGLSREQRLDAVRRGEVLAVEERALAARVSAQLDQPAAAAQGRPRAVLAHRNRWLRQRLAGSLEERGVLVVAELEDGADAVAAVVVEQPDLVFTEDLLPTVPGTQVLSRARRYAPAAMLAAQVQDERQLAALSARGVPAVFSRRVPPLEVADGLVRCLHGEQRAVQLR